MLDLFDHTKERNDGQQRNAIVGVYVVGVYVVGNEVTTYFYEIGRRHTPQTNREYGMLYEIAERQNTKKMAKSKCYHASVNGIALVSLVRPPPDIQSQGLGGRTSNSRECMRQRQGLRM